MSSLEGLAAADVLMLQLCKVGTHHAYMGSALQDLVAGVDV